MKKMILAVSLFSQNVMAGQFGQSGADGQSAWPGQAGADGATAVLDVDGKSYTFNSPGMDGEDARGSIENGGNASYCQQPQHEDEDLYGASGGDGGNGASGGAGGNGGAIGLYLTKESQLPLLKKITILNPGGKPGRSLLGAGQGGRGCHCTISNWIRYSCDWIYYQILPAQNGQPEQRVMITTAKTDCTNNSSEPSWRPTSGAGEWALQSRQSHNYYCHDGRQGRDGQIGKESQPGRFGAVVVYVGGSSKTPISPSATLKIGDAVGHTYQFSNYDREAKSGLKSLVAASSQVSNEYWLRKHYTRKLQIEWKAKVSPQDAGLSEADFSAFLVGTANQPKFEVGLPIKLTRKLTETADKTVLTITHVLNTTDPAKIEACAKNSGRGSYLCEFSDQCYYEEGDCLPR